MRAVEHLDRDLREAPATDEALVDEPRHDARHVLKGNLRVHAGSNLMRWFDRAAYGDAAGAMV